MRPDLNAEAYLPLFDHFSGRGIQLPHNCISSPRRGRLSYRVGWQVDRFCFSIECFSEYTGILPRQAAVVANSLNVLRLRGGDTAVLNNYQLREVAKLLASEEAKKRGPLQKHRINQKFLKWTIYPAMYKRKTLPSAGAE